MNQYKPGHETADEPKLYEAPVIEAVLDSDDLEREVQYAGTSSD